MNGAYELDLETINSSSITTTTLSVSGATTVVDLTATGTATVIDLTSTGTATVNNLTATGTATVIDLTSTGTATVNNLIATGTVNIGSGSLGGITQTGTDVITQSGTGTNTLKAISMVSGTNITMTGGGDVIMSSGGFLTQPSGSYITQSGGVSGGVNTLKSFNQQDDCYISQGVMSSTVDSYSPNYLNASIIQGGSRGNYFVNGLNGLTYTSGGNDLTTTNINPTSGTTFTQTKTVQTSITFSNFYNCNAYITVPISMGLVSGSLTAPTTRFITYTYTISNVRFNLVDTVGGLSISSIAGVFDYDMPYQSSTLTKTYTIQGATTATTYTMNQYYANATGVIPMTSNFTNFMMNLSHSGFQVSCSVDFTFSFALTGSGSVSAHSYTTQTIMNTTNNTFTGTGALIANTFTGYAYEMPLLAQTGDIDTSTKISGYCFANNLEVRSLLSYYRITPYFQTIASVAGSITFNTLLGTSAWITGSTAFTLTLPTTNIDDGEIIYLRKISTSNFVITLAYTATYRDTANTSIASPNTTSFLGTVNELKIIYRLETTTWHQTTN
jgi:hypothetical protein